MYNVPHSSLGNKPSFTNTTSDVKNSSALVENGPSDYTGQEYQYDNLDQLMEEWLKPEFRDSNDRRVIGGGSNSSGTSGGQTSNNTMMVRTGQPTKDKHDDQ